jgi:hypothetical protein
VIQMCKTYSLNSRLKKLAIAEGQTNHYIKDVKNETTPVDETPGAGRFAMEMIELASMETTNYCGSEGVIRHLTELEEEDRYSVIYEIARIQTLISSISNENCRSAA